jgi:hypothetical protein
VENIEVIELISLQPGKTLQCRKILYPREMTQSMKKFQAITLRATRSSQRKKCQEDQKATGRRAKPSGNI